ncbi:hypothetical protein SBA2_100003 [Acidobacteriia bacterium SbA2]|nr:hypothetical protein SBA2_100003 [Acidobacteriia bacterium SbA2]
MRPVWPRVTISEALNFPATGGNASAHDFEVSHVPATPATDLARKSLRLMDAPPKELDNRRLRRLHCEGSPHPGPQCSNFTMAGVRGQPAGIRPVGAVREPLLLCKVDYRLRGNDGYWDACMPMRERSRAEMNSYEISPLLPQAGPCVAKRISPIILPCQFVNQVTKGQFQCRAPTCHAHATFWAESRVVTSWEAPQLWL